MRHGLEAWGQLQPSDWTVLQCTHALAFEVGVIGAPAWMSIVPSHRTQGDAAHLVAATQCNMVDSRVYPGLVGHLEQLAQLRVHFLQRQATVSCPSARLEHRHDTPEMVTHRTTAMHAHTAVHAHTHAVQLGRQQARPGTVYR